jgi:hypothetical protein
MSDLGKIVLTDGGTWDAGESYEILTMVRHGGATYRSIQPSTGEEPKEDSEYWRLMAKDGNEVTVDAEISDESENPVQNKAIAARFAAQGAPVLIQEDAPSDTSALWVW